MTPAAGGPCGPSDSRSVRRRARPAVLALLLLLATSGCAQGKPEPRADTQVSWTVDADVDVPVDLPPRRHGIWPASEWPDACELAADADLLSGVSARPSAGTAPDGSRLAGAARCAWVRLGREVRLEILLVTEDVEEAWEGFTYQHLARRDVTGVGEQAFLAAHTSSRDGLWVCQGRTIFLVTSPADATTVEELTGVAAAAVASLRGTAAGVSVSG